MIPRYGLGDARSAWWIVLLALALYLLTFAVFYPQTPTNTDEASYIRQARLLLDARTTVTRVDPISGETVVLTPARYPLGTALTLAPFIWLAGWRGAFVVPCLSLLLGVFFTARWLREAGRSPLFALLVLGFPPALVLGRVAMSDAPSLALVALGLWLFWRGLDRGWVCWLASGCVAGLGLAFRESNALPYVGFYGGAVLRGERRAWALVAGVALGACVRLASAYLAYGDPFYYRPTSATFGRHGVLAALWLQLLGLLVFVPGGLLFGLAYRGRRRPDLLASLVVFVLFYLAFGYAAVEVGGARRLVIGLRFYLPLLPLLAFAAGESAPRLWLRLQGVLPLRHRTVIEAAGSALLGTWIACVLLASVLLQWAQQRWTSHQAELRTAIHAVLGPDDVVVTNTYATFKFLPWYGVHFLSLNRSDLEPASAARLVRRWGSVTFVFLDRGGSDFWREDAEQNRAFIAALRPPPQLQVDRRIGEAERLRIWRAYR